MDRFGIIVLRQKRELFMEMLSKNTIMIKEDQFDNDDEDSYMRYDAVLKFADKGAETFRPRL